MNKIREVITITMCCFIINIFSQDTLPSFFSCQTYDFFLLDKQSHLTTFIFLSPEKITWKDQLTRIEYIISIEKNGYSVDFRKKIATISSKNLGNSEIFFVEENFIVPADSYTVFCYLRDLNSYQELFSVEYKINTKRNFSGPEFSSMILYSNIWKDTTRKFGITGSPIYQNVIPNGKDFYLYFEIFLPPRDTLSPYIILLEIWDKDEQHKYYENHHVKDGNGGLFPILERIPRGLFPENYYVVKAKINSSEKTFFLGEFKIVNTIISWTEIPTDSIIFYVKALWPIASSGEKDFIKVAEKKTNNELYDFFETFWEKLYTTQYKEKFSEYRKRIWYVMKYFSTPSTQGIYTDRGYVYLKYGEPNTIDRNDMEPSSYPYEIWHYYYLPDGQRNVKFVFATEDVVTNNYTLIHSTAKGEIQDYRWRLKLNKRNFNTINLDEEDAPEHWGGRWNEKFSLPR